MSYVEQRNAEREEYRQIQAYYASIRRPWLEWSTFSLALLMSVAVSLRRFGIGFTDYVGPGQWLTLAYWLAFLVFAGADTLFTKVRHPVPVAFGGFHPSRIYEKFAVQKRAWQLLLVLMLPLTARLVAAAMVFMAAH